MPSSLVNTADPAQEPVSLSEAKAYLRVDDSDNDAVIGILISAARAYAEDLCGRSFITQQLRLTLDCFPREIRLEQGPVQSIQSIQYTAMSGSTITVSSSDYVTDLAAPLPRIAPGFGKTWPPTLPQIGAVRVNYTAGYGDTGSSVPAGIKHWILMRVSTLFENREEMAIGGRIVVAPLPYVDRLLDPYTVSTA